MKTTKTQIKKILKDLAFDPKDDPSWGMLEKFSNPAAIMHNVGCNLWTGTDIDDAIQMLIFAKAMYESEEDRSTEGA